VYDSTPLSDRISFDGQNRTFASSRRHGVEFRFGLTNEVDAVDEAHREPGKGPLEEEMGPSSAMAHLYRGEVHRMKFWRKRLDRTTNSVVLVISAILTWDFQGRISLTTLS